ncbi:hypothetical protein LP420_40285 [Massilia sp. B-10]|nr:hypothetical protein LP420_40285 [Massilia sp. B-10]
MQSLQNVAMLTVEGIGGNQRGHETGDMLSLSLILHGISVDNSPTTSSNNSVTVGANASVEAGVNNQSLVHIKPMTLSGVPQIDPARIGTELTTLEKSALGLDADIHYMYAPLNLSTIPFSINTGTVIKVIGGANNGGNVGEYYQWKPVTEASTEIILENENFADTTRWRALGGSTADKRSIRTACRSTRTTWSCITATPRPPSAMRSTASSM